MQTVLLAKMRGSEKAGVAAVILTCAILLLVSTFRTAHTRRYDETDILSMSVAMETDRGTGPAWMPGFRPALSGTCMSPTHAGFERTSALWPQRRLLALALLLQSAVADTADGDVVDVGGAGEMTSLELSVLHDADMCGRRIWSISSPAPHAPPPPPHPRRGGAQNPARDAFRLRKTAGPCNETCSMVPPVHVALLRVGGTQFEESELFQSSIQSSLSATVRFMAETDEVVHRLQAAFRSLHDSHQVRWFCFIFENLVHAP